MEINETQYGSALVLYPDGRLDQYSATIFQEKLLLAVGGGHTAVIVDFSKVPYVSSTGLRAIGIAARQSKANGISLAVSDLTPEVGEIFSISRYNFVVDVHAILRDAVAAVSEKALRAFESA